MFHYTIGIAGHIDHGKTTLTKVLTGIDTDRLKEEKERNISIETGFAHLVLSNGQQAGIVDVPGHERFIRQMISGVAGIDMVLLTVAADEGVMPQTREHLDILQLLGVRKGIVVVSKKDLVDEEFLQLVFQDIAGTVKGTFLEHAPILPVSAKTGEGIPELKRSIEESLANVPGKDVQAPFRMPIDRAFTVKGAGTVVTGTIFEGAVQIGDTLRILPQDTMVRVRQLQVHHQKVERGEAGQRTAINLSGMDHDRIRRGDVLVAPDFLEPTSRIDLFFTSLSSHEVALKNRSRVFVYCGTAEVEGKILFFDRNVLHPGEQAYVQLLLDEPVVVKRDDPVIVRRPTPPVTLGGGRVINAYGRKYRFHPQTIAHLEQEHRASLRDRILFRLRLEEKTIEEIAKELTIPVKEILPVIEILVKEGEVIPLTVSSLLSGGDLLAHKDQILEKEEALLKTLEEYHKKNPSQPGMKKSEAKERFSGWKPEVFAWIMERLQAGQRIRSQGERISLASFRPHLPPGLEQRAKSLLNALRQEGREVSDWQTLAERFGLDPKQGEEVRRFFLSAGEIVEMDEKWVWPRSTWEETVKLLQEKRSGPELTIAEVKELLGLSRKYIIPILERLDKEGYTIRQGDKRIWMIGP